MGENGMLVLEQSAYNSSYAIWFISFTSFDRSESKVVLHRSQRYKFSSPVSHLLGSPLLSLLLALLFLRPYSTRLYLISTTTTRGNCEEILCSFDQFSCSMAIVYVYVYKIYKSVVYTAFS